MPTPPNVEEIERDRASERWRGIERPYNTKDIEKLRGTKICGASYFDVIAENIVGIHLSTGALAGSTEEEQFEEVRRTWS